MLSFIDFVYRGLKGVRYGTSKVSILHSLVINIIPATINPIAPITVEKIINKNLHHLNALTISISEKRRPVTDVIATTITTMGETIPAFTAASPKTKAPTILMEVPIVSGSRISLSLRISKVAIKIITAKEVGKGTPALWTANEISRVSGMIS